jgi:GNAT superfamily N-acetyltransferase
MSETPQYVDLLVKLYELSELAPALEKQQANGVMIRRAIAPEKYLVTQWLRKHFSAGWESECGISFHRTPISCYIAVRDSEILGFACYDATCRGFFGPIGVAEDERGNGLGKALLLACMHAMRSVGYGYAVIGAAGPIDFFKKSVEATVIPDSWPSVYRGMLWEKA